MDQPPVNSPYLTSQMTTVLMWEFSVQIDRELVSGSPQKRGLPTSPGYLSHSSRLTQLHTFPFSTQPYLPLLKKILR